MNHREFFYAVSEMRAAQKEYFRNRDQRTLAAAIMREKEVDEEITRVKQYLQLMERQAAPNSSTL